MSHVSSVRTQQSVSDCFCVGAIQFEWCIILHYLCHKSALGCSCSLQNNFFGQIIFTPSRPCIGSISQNIYSIHRRHQFSYKMWHEARKQERKIRGMLVDYRKRAERRQDFYEKIVSVITLTPIALHLWYCVRQNVYFVHRSGVMCLWHYCLFDWNCLCVCVNRKPIQRSSCRSIVENARFTWIRPLLQPETAQPSCKWYICFRQIISAGPCILL